MIGEAATVAWYASEGATALHVRLLLAGSQAGIEATAGAAVHRRFSVTLASRRRPGRREAPAKRCARPSRCTTTGRPQAAGLIGRPLVAAAVRHRELAGSKTSEGGARIPASAATQQYTNESVFMARTVLTMKITMPSTGHALSSPPSSESGASMPVLLSTIAATIQAILHLAHVYAATCP